MINHMDLGDTAFRRSRKLKELIDQGKIQFAGNKKLKIYGTLSWFFRQKNEGGEPCILRVTKGSEEPGLPPLRALHARGVPAMESTILKICPLIRYLRSA